MSHKSYELVNPVITGTIETTFDADNALDAANQFWTNFTVKEKNISGNLPKFMFTLKDGDGKLYHFMVEETPNDSKNAKYNITQVEHKMTEAQEKEFLEAIANAKKMSRTLVNKQNGGKKNRYDDSSSSSSSDEDDLFRFIRTRRVLNPVTYWWYAPTVYNVRSVFTPTFVSPLSPYVQLWFPLR